MLLKSWAVDNTVAKYFIYEDHNRALPTTATVQQIPPIVQICLPNGHCLFINTMTMLFIPYIYRERQLPFH